MTAACSRLVREPWLIATVCFSSSCYRITRNTKSCLFPWLLWRLQESIAFVNRLLKRFFDVLLTPFSRPRTRHFVFYRSSFWAAKHYGKYVNKFMIIVNSPWFNNSRYGSIHRGYCVVSVVPGVFVLGSKPPPLTRIAWTGLETRPSTRPHILIKNLFMLSVRVSSYGCTREVSRARKMRKSCTRR